MGGFPTGVPNQWWRFILPLFLHVGAVDLVIMVVFQVRTLPPTPTRPRGARTRAPAQS